PHWTCALDLDAHRYILKRPKTHAKPFDARMLPSRRGRGRRGGSLVRMAPDAGPAQRRTDDGRPDVARRDRALARRFRRRRPRPGGALRPDLALARDRLLPSA